jgi:hypothetical protein
MDLRWINRQRLIERPLGVLGPHCDGCGGRIALARDMDGCPIRFCPNGCRAGSTGLPFESAGARELRPRNTRDVVPLAPWVTAKTRRPAIALAD